MTFSLLAVAVHVLDRSVAPGITARVFTLGGHFSWLYPLDYLRLVAYPLGHSHWNHLLSNIPLILLLGAFVEDKYGSWDVLAMMAITAISAGLVNVVFFSTGLRGASGLVYMLIVLASLGNFRRGELPLTFVLVAGFYLTAEVVAMTQPDQIAQWGHIAGGVMGGVMGLWLGPEASRTPTRVR
ncbi:MAG: rhomboid family intramembrane serine protease [Phycisphaerae bacterium]